MLHNNQPGPNPFELPFGDPFGDPISAVTTGVTAIDPNDLIGPDAYGDQNFVASTPLPFTIDFENQPTATAPAQSVTITEQLDSHLEWRTFQLGTIGFGGRTIAVPAGFSYYTTQVDLGPSGGGLLVRVSAGIDPTTGIVTWKLTSIDPATGLPPSDPTVGLLPPEDGNGSGEGFVTYTIQPKAGLPTGTTINSQAVIVFDTNPSIATNSVLDTLDALAPTSLVGPLPAVEPDKDFTVSWSGQDDTNGSGLEGYDVLVSIDGGPWTVWLSGTSDTAAVYHGAAGHAYAFLSSAHDHAGNVEALRRVPDAVTSVPGLAVTIDPTGPGPLLEGDTFIGSGSFTDPLGTSWTATVDYGDGSGPQPLALNGDRSFTLDHRYTTFGTFTIAVTVSDDQDGVGIAQRDQAVDNVAPVVVLGPARVVNAGQGGRFVDAGSFADPGTESWTATVDYGDNSGPQSLSLGAGQTFALDHTYAADGAYTVTVTVSDGHDSGSAMQAVIVDLTPPAAQVVALDAVQTSLTFPVTIQGSDPSATSGVPGSGIASFDLYVSTDGGGYVLYAGLPAGAPDAFGRSTATTTFTGQDHATYAFYAVAHDAAGNVQATPGLPQAQTLVVITRPTTVALQSSKTPSTFGDPLTFTATVAADQGGPGAPGGSVQFRIDGVPFGSPVVLVAGSATSGSIAGLGAGSHDVTVEYLGDGPFLPSSSPVLVQSVAPANLTITAVGKSRVYGAANPPLTATYSGFVNGDDPSDLTAGVMLATTAGAGSHVGLYPITASGGSSPNYTIMFVTGTLSVTPAPLTITANSASKVYAQPLPAFSAAYSGFVNGDTSASLATPVILATPATINSALGTYAITAGGATDPDYAIHFVAGTLTIKAWDLQAEPANPAQRMLVVGGTPGADDIEFDLDRHASGVEATLNGTSLGVFTMAISRIMAFGGPGDDQIHVAEKITLPAWLFGGEGDDDLKGGGGDGVLVGGPGNNHLKAGKGRDLLIGGAGVAHLEASGGDDLLIAGTTDYDMNMTALDAIMAEWTSSRDYRTRVANLSGTGQGPRANGQVFLIAGGPNATVHGRDDQADGDQLDGGSGMDWFFADLDGNGQRKKKDKVNGAKNGEVITGLS